MSKKYIAFTFAPVQGFIEKSRKLRDLYGASRILSHLSAKIVDFAQNDLNLEVISPALLRVQPESERGGIPNRILLRGTFSDLEEEETLKTIEATFLAEWKKVLSECKRWVQEALESYYQPQDWGWDEEWNHWANHAWELFFGVGTTIPEAINDLENRKLQRDWTAINWIGESSSLTGTDAIAFPGLGGKCRNPKTLCWSKEEKEIKRFYRYLAFLLDNPQYRQRDLTQISPNIEPEGRYVAANEKLSIPELTKRLVTYPKISQTLGMPDLERFTELVRRAQDNPKGNGGQWTGWFMGDGDRVGDYLNSLADRADGDSVIQNFSQAMRDWGNRFYTNFPENLGRVVYAGGDDFLGVIYNKDFPKTSQNSVNTIEILRWLMQLPQEWQRGKSEEINQKITLSLGFVWAAQGVPQRDILQHCREAEKRSKTQGRKRVTLRIVFGNGQYVQWTTPWQYLRILEAYEDRDGEKNWSHVYRDLAQLEARHAFGLGSDDPEAIPDKILDDCKAVLEFFDLYFPGYQQELQANRHQLFEFAGKKDTDKAWAMMRWIHDLITVGWYLCSNI